MYSTSNSQTTEKAYRGNKLAAEILTLSNRTKLHVGNLLIITLNIIIRRLELVMHNHYILPIFSTKKNEKDSEAGFGVIHKVKL